MKSALSQSPSCRLSASFRVKSIYIFNGNAGSYLVGASFSSVQFSCSVQIFTVAEMSKFHICNTKSKSIPSLAVSYIKPPKKSNMGVRSSSGSKASPCKAGDPWIRKWQPTPVFMPGEFLGQMSLAGYSPWGCRVGHDWATNTHTQSLTHIWTQNIYK